MIQKKSGFAVPMHSRSAPDALPHAVPHTLPCSALHNYRHYTHYRHYYTTLHYTTYTTTQHYRNCRVGPIVLWNMDIQKPKKKPFKKAYKKALEIWF